MSLKGQSSRPFKAPWIKIGFHMNASQHKHPPGSHVCEHSSSPDADTEEQYTNDTEQSSEVFATPTGPFPFFCVIKHASNQFTVVIFIHKIQTLCHPMDCTQNDNNFWRLPKVAPSSKLPLSVKTPPWKQTRIGLHGVAFTWKPGLNPGEFSIFLLMSYFTLKTSMMPRWGSR